MMKVIVTGHTRGLGAAIASELVSRKIPVLGLARRKNLELAQRYPQLLEQVELDLADTAKLAQWLGSGALQGFLSDAGTAALINNAGVVQPIGALETQDIDAVARAVSLNVATPMMLSSALAALPGLKERRILHVSSGAGTNAYPGWSVYCATKAALDHHARAAALDESVGLRICSLAPGVIDTDMQAELRATGLDKFPLRERFDDLKRSGALVNPTDCARQLVDYLISEHFGQVPVADLRRMAV